jgi:hypothetical protein
MSNLTLSPWNHLCWKDEGMSFDLDALLKIYNEVFSKYTRHIQTEYYSGIGFQGSTDDDHLSAAKRVTTSGVIIDGVLQAIPRNRLQGYYPKLVEETRVRHKDLCIGEFEKIIDYLENNGWTTFRGRIIEDLPDSPDNWRLDMHDESLRYHVPLITNEECYIQYRDENKEIKTFHLPADGSGYWLKTNFVNQKINKGTDLRAYIVIDLFKK